MKKIFSLIILSIFSVIVLSCKDEDRDPMLSLSTKATLASDASSIILNEAIAGNKVITFTWVKPVFNTSITSKETLELGKAGANFKPSKIYELPEGVSSASITHLEMNNIAAAIGLASDVVNQVEVRLVSKLGLSTYYYSDPIVLSVTPYTPNPDLIYPKIHVPGNYGAAIGYGDWGGASNDPSQAAPSLFSPDSNGKYRGFLYLNVAAPEFKFTKGSGWDLNKGDIAENPNTFTTLEDNGKNVKPVVGNKNYYIKVDWLANTYTMTPAVIGIAGGAISAGGDAPDNKLVYNPSTKNWEIASIALTSTGVFKFRANDDWQMKFQPANGDQTLVSGTAVKTFLNIEETVTGDPNYKVSESGNYKVVLDLHNSAYYKLTVTKL